MQSSTGQRARVSYRRSGRYFPPSLRPVRQAGRHGSGAFPGSTNRIDELENVSAAGEDDLMLYEQVFKPAEKDDIRAGARN